MRARRVLAVLGLAVAVGALAVHPPGATDAAWTDRETTRATLQAAVLPGVGSLTCVNQAGGLLPNWALISWPVPAGLPSNAVYEVRVTKGTSSVAVTTSNPSQPITVGTLDLLGLLLGSSGPATVAVSTVVLDGSQVVWRSSSVSTRTVQYTAPVLGLLLGGWSCVP